MGQYTDALQKLYVAYFNRPADPGGLEYWNNVMQHQNISLSDISNTFATSPEYRDTYAGMNNQQVVNQVYVNLFGRNAEAAGLQYWTALLDSKQISLANVVTIIGNGAQNSDLISYNAKTTAASSFTMGLQRSFAESGYNTPEAKVLARSFIASVTDEASLQLARATMQSVIDKINVPEKYPPNTQLLTKGIDVMKGGDAADSFNAGSDGMALTLQANDMLDGGAGLDHLLINITSRSSFTTPSSISINNIENVTLTSNSKVDLNTTAWQGVNQLHVTAIGTTTLTADSATSIHSTVTLHDAGLNIQGGKDVTVKMTEVAMQATNAQVVPALQIGGQQAPTGKVIVQSALQSVDSLLQQASPINIQGGSEVSITQVSAEQGNNSYRPASVVSITGTDITTKVSSTVPSSSTISDSPTYAVQSLKITDANAHSASKLGSIGNVYIAGHSDSSIATNALSTLELRDVQGKVSIDNSGGYQGAAQTLALNLMSVNAAIVDKDVYRKAEVNIQAGTNSILSAIGGKAMQALSVNGNGELSLAEDFATLSLQDISVSGQVFMRLPTFAVLPNLTMLDFSANTGGGSANLNAAQTTFVGGSGKESISLVGASMSKNIDLGAGDDVLTVGRGEISSGTLLHGGSGEDNIYLNWSDAATFFDAAARDKVQGFEVLTLQNPGNLASVDLRNAPLFEKVAIGKISADNKLSISNLTNKATIYCSTSEGGSLTVAGTTAEQGAISSATLNTLSYDVAQLTAAMENIEQVTLQMNSVGGIWHTPGGAPTALMLGMHLHADQTQRLTIQGNSGVNLDFTGKALQSLDASQFTGHALKWTAGVLQGNVDVRAAKFSTTSIDLSQAVSANVSYVGGSGADILKVAGGVNTISVGIGDDVLTISAVGKDRSTYTTVRDAHQGMKIVLPELGTTQFTSSALQVANAQSLNSYLDGAIASLGNAASNAAGAWFQFQGDTYYVQSRHDGRSNAQFVDGTDMVVKLTGLLDLSLAQMVGNSLVLG